MAIIDYEDYLEAGHYIFPLHPITNGRCGCGGDDCKMAGKHPVMSNWQHITTWDDEQLAYLTDEENLTGINQFQNGFGVNLAGRYLVVDVDARNGGIEAFKRLCESVGADLLALSCFAVRTGSGGGSMHLYFLAPTPPVSLVTTHDNFKGVDFKSSGYVVGCGSEHISGDRYEVLHGSPSDIGEAPEGLIELLRKQETMRTFDAGKAVDFTMSELEAIVLSIHNTERDYERFIRVGMGVHAATSGSAEGYDLWLKWSEKSDAHDDTLMFKKWRSFSDGKSAIVTLGTLILWAKECGYQEAVTFESSDVWQDDSADNVTSDSVRLGVNLKRPPSLVGDIVEWINSRSLFPREHLAVAAALTLVSNCAGLRYRIAGTNTSLNQVIFGIASSATGKESVYQRLIDGHYAIGLSPAVHGNIKSEQEITRNALRNQASFYVIDEIGTLLTKLNNAKKSGGSAYLEGVLATVMAMYSKATGIQPVGGDAKADLREKIQKDIARAQKSLDRTGHEEHERELKNLVNELKQADHGIVEPFLSIYGTAEPYTFAAGVDREMMVAGFMGRALVVEEPNNAPNRKPIGSVSHADMPQTVQMRLAMLYSGGSVAFDDDRIRRHGDVNYLTMSDEAEKACDDVYNYWHGMARNESDAGTGLEPIVLRAWEATLKVAGTLAALSGVITLEHVRYAHALVYKSTMWKLNKAKAAEGAGVVDTETKSEGVLAAVRSIIDHSERTTLGVIKNRYRSHYTKDQIKAALDYLVSEGEIESVTEKGANGREYTYYIGK